jgi:phosphatidylglycerol:prolipoprotein diacylglycerol transferase
VLHLLAKIHYPNLNPVIVRLGPIALKWYGVAYLAGFALAYLVLRSLIRRGILRLTPERLADLMGWLVVGVMVGGRAGWWLFYHRPAGAVEPWYESLAVWHGGMSFHGGLIGVVLAMAIWCRAVGASFWNVADAAALVTPIGLCLGRIANFINAELVGRPTAVAWGVIFPGDNFARHPSQLYEAILEGPALLLILWLILPRACRRDGTIATWFLALYGAFRFAVEFTREPDSQLGFIAFGWLTMGQLLSAGLILLSVALWVFRRAAARGCLRAERPAPLQP